MKKSDFSRRSPGKPGNGRNQNRAAKPPGNRNPRPNSRAKNSAAVQQWLSAPSTALSSHINMGIKNQQDGEGRNSNTRNGSSRFSAKGKGKFRSNQDGQKQNTRPHRSSQRPTHRRDTPNGNDRRANVAQQNPRPQSQTNTNSQPKKVANLDPFELFCAYHLGIGPTKNYKPSNINEVANRFRQDPAMIRQALKEYGMDSGSLLDRDFDMAMAQLDIQVAPEGVDRVELAKTIYEDFKEAPHVKRDWKKILDEDRKENSKVFGRN